MKVFLGSFIIFAIKIGMIATLSCYVCGGYNCFAEDKTQVDCKENTTSLCYYITANNSDMFRGCYEEADPNYLDCKDHILNTCLTCNTSLCNNGTPYMEERLACYKCSPPSPDCRDNMFITHHHKPCRPFMYSDRASCYSFYHHRTNEYEFGCMSEASEYIRITCDHDWFKFTCKICYLDRCNVELFYNELESDLVCSTRISGEGVNTQITCPYAEGNLPYYACYIENMFEYWAKGCISERFRGAHYTDWKNLMTPPVPGQAVSELFVCLGHDCNTVQYENYTNCYRDPVKSCSSFYHDVGTCMAITTDDPKVFDARCEARYPCWKPELCPYRCQGIHVLANQQKISCLDAKWTKQFYCYTCEDCPIINDDHLSPIAHCDKEQCSEALIDGKLARGCRSERFNQVCSKEDGICRHCDEEYCNHGRYGIYCITCTYENNLCTYDPVETYNTKCDIPIVQNMTYGCYSQMRYDGLVYRGCYDTENYTCPESHVCTTCHEDYCNRDLFLNGSCFTCSGDLHSNCANNETYIGLSNMTFTDQCQIVFGIPLCYTIVEDSIVRRGCTSDEYMPIIHKDCGYRIQCHFCDSQMCNFFTFSPKGPLARAGREPVMITASSGARGFGVKMRRIDVGVLLLVLVKGIIQ